MLPFFTSVPEEPLAELQKALECLVASHFPMQSDEFAKGSLHRNNYMDCIRKASDFILCFYLAEKEEKKKAFFKCYFILLYYFM